MNKFVIALTVGGVSLYRTFIDGPPKGPNQRCWRFLTDKARAYTFDTEREALEAINWVTSDVRNRCRVELM